MNQNAALTQALEKKLNTLTERLDRIKSDVSRVYSSDSAERAQERENDEVVDAIGNETQQSILNIQAALQRIEEGNYGICDNCGDSIAESRLDVLPEATLCVKCAP